MYALAVELWDESEDPALAEAAAQVVETLQNVVDLPIASSKLLEEARRRFNILVAHLRNVGGNTVPPSVVVPPSHDVEKLLCQILDEDALRTELESPADRIMRSGTKR
jgi:hypothetical protein